MRGQILGVDQRAGEGQIAGEDGRRYAFRPEDWAHRGEPAIGLQVDFEPENSRALSIFPVPGAQPIAMQMYPAALREPTTNKSKIVAALLAFFLGVLGVHRFYLGRTGSGIVMLVLTITVIGTLITMPWSWIDTIRYLVMSDRDFARRFGRD
jgi:TM2 domain-containing membrane protein YozV